MSSTISVIELERTLERCTNFDTTCDAALITNPEVENSDDAVLEYAETLLEEIVGLLEDFQLQLFFVHGLDHVDSHVMGNFEILDLDGILCILAEARLEGLKCQTVAVMPVSVVPDDGCSDSEL